jgi:probable F420-dependent oxidoreductase
MQIGFGLPVSGTWATPQSISRFATLAEANGYHSLWAFQRLLVGADQQLDPVYHSVLDPLVALGFAAATTDRVRLGVAIVNVPFVEPAYLAKQAATVDVLSDGRLDLGLGAGWSEPEFAAVSASPERRGPRITEYVAALRALFADGVSEHRGEFYTIPPSRVEPKPVQRPAPPILLGGAAPAALRRAGRIADGWISRSATDLSSIGDDISVVRESASEAGRDPDELRFISRGVLRLSPDGRPIEGERRPLSGSFEQVLADLAVLEQQGVTEVFYDLNWDPQIGNPDVDPKQATERAEAILLALRPA